MFQIVHFFSHIDYFEIWIIPKRIKSCPTLKPVFINLKPMKYEFILFLRNKIQMKFQITIYELYLAFKITCQFYTDFIWVYKMKAILINMSYNLTHFMTGK